MFKSTLTIILTSLITIIILSCDDSQESSPIDSLRKEITINQEKFPLNSFTSWCNDTIDERILNETLALSYYEGSGWEGPTVFLWLDVNTNLEDSTSKNCNKGPLAYRLPSLKDGFYEFDNDIKSDSEYDITSGIADIARDQKPKITITSGFLEKSKFFDHVNVDTVVLYNFKLKSEDNDSVTGTYFHLQN